MPSVVLELGELEHVHDSQNLKLRTNITLSLSQLAPLSFFDFANLEKLVSTGTWIAGGNRLRIHIRFIFDDIEISDYGDAGIVEEIGMRLCNAEIWSQLGLDATHNLSEVGAEGNDHANELFLTLGEKRTDHATVNAPESVPSACLENISLLFNFSPCRRIRFSLHVREQPTGLVRVATPTASFHTHDADAFAISHGRPRPEQQWLRVDTDLHCQEQDQAIGSLSQRQVFPRTTNQSSSFEMSVPNSRGRDPSRPSLGLGLSGTCKTESLLPNSKHVSQKTMFRPLLRLLDASLRLALCDRAAPKCEGIMLAKDTGFPRLVEIAPALFSPRFLEAVSQRNSLLPSIAHTLSRVCHRTRSRSLKHTLDCLLKTVPRGDMIHDSTRSDDPQSTKTSLSVSIQARLWFLMQQKLLDPQTWPQRKFEILGGPQTACERELGQQILDKSIMDQDVETFPNNEDVDLILETQYTSVEIDSGISDHTFDQSKGLGVDYSGNDPLIKAKFSIDDDGAVEGLLCPDWMKVSDDRSAEEGVPYIPVNTFGAGGDIDEDLFTSQRFTQGPYQNRREAMLDSSSNAEIDYYSQDSSESLVRCESNRLWDNYSEEMLDDEREVLQDLQRYTGEPLQYEPYQEDLLDMLNKGNGVLDDGLAHSLAREDDCQTWQDNFSTEQVLSECSALNQIRQVDHEEILDDAKTTLQSNHSLSEQPMSGARYGLDHQELTDETENILDPQITTVADAGFCDSFFGHDGEEILDNERMIFEADQGNQALIMV